MNGTCIPWKNHETISILIDGDLCQKIIIIVMKGKEEEEVEEVK